MSVELLVVFPYYLLYVFRVYSNSPHFILDIGNLCLLSFFVSLASGLSILLIFSKNQLLVTLIFSIAFSVSMSLISALVFIIFFLLLAVISGGFCSYSMFLR